MFARLTIGHIKSDRIDEFIKGYEEDVVPVAKSQKGYHGSYLLMDHKTGKSVSITLQYSEKDAIANEENLYYQEQLIKFLNLLTEPSYIREGYEVSVKN